MYVCMYVLCVYVCMYVCIMCVCMYVCIMCVCMYACMRALCYIHTCIHMRRNACIIACLPCLQYFIFKNFSEDDFQSLIRNWNHSG